ncbi:MAG: 1-deoxy-D-xylulose-5-phosphate reductoisomerase [Planctomycetaceae bacterium]|nr:1-deoxy-D-xylulose-5-phosphate reductoisomerase [Planctomycetaceae bacterium]MBP61825.1 1-deoxy-D-xylulose-5-phosphate reductoisomerase [Planctomycetaceae bacterium]
MNDRPTNVAVLGSTGSIGQSTLAVIAESGGRFRALALSTNTSTQRIIEQAFEFAPQCIVVADQRQAAQLDASQLPAGTELFSGAEDLSRVAALEEVDVVVAAIVGSAGLLSTWSALEAGKRVALANKETMVMAGPLAIEVAQNSGAQLLPVDSEHSAVFQALQAGRPQDVRRVILTASGGPFRQYTPEQLQHVTVDQALEHPTWKMGKKITVDSATMMNKALEIIEARWLFQLKKDQIDVVIHPQSVVHSMVEYVDGSVIAQLSPPDMRLPIQYALSYPERWKGPAKTIDWTRAQQLTFEPPDNDRFPALALGLEVAQAGGTTGAVLNAANEAAVARFLDGRLAFSNIVPACRAVLQQHNFETHPDLERLIALDAWARQEIAKWVNA